MNTQSLPSEIAKLAFLEAERQSGEVPTDHFDLGNSAPLNWIDSQQGFDFWRKINMGDFSPFYELQLNKSKSEQTMKLAELPVKLAELLIEEAAQQGFTISLEKHGDVLLPLLPLDFSETTQGQEFWKHINFGDYTPYFNLAKEAVKAEDEQEETKIPKHFLSQLPAEIAELVKLEAELQGKLFEVGVDYDLSNSAIFDWKKTRQGKPFWRTILWLGDYQPFEDLKAELEEKGMEGAKHASTPNSDNLFLVKSLQELEATGKVKIVIVKSHCKLGFHLSSKIEEQVIMKIVHSIPAITVEHSAIDDEEERNSFTYAGISAVDIEKPKVRLDIYITDKDNFETIAIKVAVATEKLAELAQVDKIIDLRESEDLFECMEGYFGEQNRIFTK